MDAQKTDRLRQHPDQRFAGPQHPFDLEAMAVKLRQETRAGESGHRQESLYKHGGASVSLFVFGKQTRLPPHRTRGIVSIHVLKGHLQVTAEGKVHDLRGGNLLVLAADVEHDVVAQEESEMLLTVHLQPAREGMPG